MKHPALPPGIITPLVTFVDRSGKPDKEATAALVDHQITGGVAGLLAVGSTGELGNLSQDQRSATIRAVVEETRGRVPVWAGVAGLGTTDTVNAARAAESEGADALLALQPLFFDASDAELGAHFRAVDAAVTIPVLAYNVPARTPRTLPTSLLRDLGEEGVLAGVKDSSGDLAVGRQLCYATTHLPEFHTYIGSEITIDAALHLGFQGAVPGLANVLPHVAVQIHDAWTAGETEGVGRAQQTYLELLRIIDAPLPAAGFSARAINAIKVATAVVLGLPVPLATTPFIQPDEGFVESVRAVVERCRGGAAPLLLA